MKINLLKKSLIMVLNIISIISASHSFAEDLTKPFDVDWNEVGEFKLNYNSSKLDYENAYWLGALSNYSYWYYKNLIPFYTAPKNKIVEIQVTTPDTDNPSVMTQAIHGYGFNKVKFFSSKLMLKPDGRNLKNPYLIQKWPAPLPEEACVKPGKTFCFDGETRINPAKLDITTQQEIESCGVSLEKALYSPEEMQNFTAKEKSKIQKIVTAYEEKYKINVGLDFNDNQFIYRCEAFKHLNADDPDTQMGWFENDDFIAIVFRGTEIDSKGDRSTDFTSQTVEILTLPINTILNATKLTIAEQRIHEGFNRAIEVTRENLFFEFSKSIESQQKSGKPAKPVLLAGHSLGGALAQELTYYILDYNKKLDPRILNSDGINLKAVYTYGSPRIGNSYWVTELDQLTSFYDVGNYRFVNHNDPIPHAPCDDFIHAGTTIYLNPHDELDIPDNDPYKFVEAIINPSKNIVDMNSCALTDDLLSNLFNLRSHLGDHFMTSYYGGLKKLLKDQVK